MMMGKAMYMYTFYVYFYLYEDTKESVWEKPVSIIDQIPFTYKFILYVRVYGEKIMCV